ncbi:metal-sensitive transcriptional regulator [Salinisphaera sp. RV14]|uniref:metal-sensitive transcriptional regulator n=1 Tax=Salinisphaera sp. RV14 TaxID=3454140 RepID=UPI003F82E344
MTDLAHTANDPEWESNKAALVRRLKRIEGQVRGLQTMIERDAECEDIAVQMSAARKALDRTFYNMLSCVIEHELNCHGLDAEDARQRLKYATELLARYG